MTKNFYLDGMLDCITSYPGKVQITIPIWTRQASGQGYSAVENIYGILSSEPTFTSRNKWGPILTDVSNLTDISSMLGDNEVFSWVSASTQCWKGTDPLSFSLDFYLINYKSGLGLEEKLMKLNKLTALDQSSDRFGDVKVVPHGGYAADVWKSNKEQFKDVFKDDGYDRNNRDRIEKGKNLFFSPVSSPGTVTVKIGDGKQIPNLLISRLDVTPSLAEVMDFNKGAPPKPLYYRVSVGFTGTTPLLAKTVDQMYGG